MIELRVGQGPTPVKTFEKGSWLIAIALGSRVCKLPEDLPERRPRVHEAFLCMVSWFDIGNLVFDCALGYGRDLDNSGRASDD